MFKKRKTYDTQLSPADEARFQQRFPNPNDVYDYDLRGAWKGNAQAAGNGHLPDTWKKPNHPTFSQESMYSTPDQTGGKWIEGPNGKWIFAASPWNMSNLGAQGIVDYFDEREPDAIPVLPINYRLPPGRR